MSVVEGCFLAGIALFLAGLILVWNKGWSLKIAGCLMAVAGGFLVLGSEQSLMASGSVIGLLLVTVSSDEIGLLLMLVVMIVLSLLGLRFLLSKFLLRKG
jgi:hypothetical protein